MNTRTHVQRHAGRSRVALCVALAIWASAPIDGRTDPVAAKSLDWFSAQIRSADADCRAARDEIARNEALARETERMLGRLAADSAARMPAQRALSNAQAAARRNAARADRRCGAGALLQATMQRIDPRTVGASGVPLFMHGTVEIVRDGRATPWDGATALAPGDTIRTGVDGRVEVALLGSRHRILLDARSSLTVATIGPDLGRGRYLWSAALEMAQANTPELLRLRTQRDQTIAMAVRGTRFALDARGDEPMLEVLEGEVVVSTPEGEAPVRAGERVRLNTEGRVIEAGRIDPAALSMWWE